MSNTLFDRIRQKQLNDNLIEVVLPEDIVSNFASLYGVDTAKETLQDVVTYFKKKIPNFKPYTSYAIVGPHGTKKASLVFATAKEAGMPVVSVDTSIFEAQDESSVSKKFHLVFSTANVLKKEYGGCFVIFQNIHQTEEMENISIFYLNLVKSFRNTKNIFLFGLSSLDSWAVPTLVVQEGIFQSVVSINYPDLATREKIFAACIKTENLKIAPDVSLNRLAKDTYGETYRDIERIVKDTHLYSLRQKHPKATQNDFSETIMRLSSGEKSSKMTEKERRLTAYHEAGHVIAAYFSNPNYALTRVEISPRSQSLGLTVSEIDESKHTYFKKDFENLIILCYGGLAAEELVFGAHSSGVSADLVSATLHATNTVRAYGMCEEFGPFAVIPGLTDSLYAKDTTEKLIQKLLNELLAKTKEIVKENRPYLDALAEALIEKEVVLGNEIEEIFKKVSEELKKAAIITPETSSQE